MANWQRDKEGMGLWEHRGKVAVVGWGQSYIQRRWDGVDLERSCGGTSKESILKAISDAGIGLDEIDGLMTSKETRAEQTWAPRPYFAPPYDTEDGLTYCSGEFIQKELGLKNVKYIESDAPYIGPMLGMAAQAVGDGMAETLVCWYPMVNLSGRYGHNNPANNSNEAKGGNAFTLPWGYQSGAMFNNAIVFQQYCQRYNTSHEALAPFVMNQRRNGLLTPWSYYSLHEPYQLTKEDYLNGRVVEEPLVVYDCDRPVMACAAFIFTTAEKAKKLRQKPVYILNHAQNSVRGRSTMATLDEHQEAVSSLARKMEEGSGVNIKDVDIFNPYDGYATFTQQFLEGFQWHGVGRGEAHDFYADDIRVEGPHPFLSSGGNLGTGRTRSALHSDSIEQLRGTAGPRQVNVKAEIALAGSNTPDACGFVMYSSHQGS
ncbi:MAG: thiolase family protein [Dehalococcoidia bacterium]|jgi:acetyl-CoA acetyltransferase|nr:thiolase family protein [Dehalococcoidia bacterium]|tara:strand:+ start:1458 stop:2747 length:1290 start_codon:yes stop_codon:yes gene_type:complete